MTGERLVSFKLHVLVFVKYRPAVVVQFDDKAVSSLYGGDFYIPVPNVAPFEVVHVRIAQPAETAEQKDVPYPFEILLGRGVSCSLSACSVHPKSGRLLFFEVVFSFGLNVSYAMF